MVRTSIAFVTVLACHPSATVESTMPVANLQTYRTVAVRVHANANVARGETRLLETSVLARLQQQCGFEQINGAGAPDVTLDLNITNTGRGGSGWIQNQNQATLDALVVLADGQNGELLGTVRVHGQSSGIVINSAPENEAIDVVAKTIADLLAKSGCSGPRIARVVEPPPPPPPQAPDESHRAEAEAFNDQGKEKLQTADMPAALVLFQQANTVLPDARYEFNVCITLAAQEQWAGADAACRKARTMNPPERLVTKIDHRLELIQHHQ